MVADNVRADVVAVGGVNQADAGVVDGIGWQLAA